MSRRDRVAGVDEGQRATDVEQVCVRFDYQVSGFPNLPIGRPVKLARTPQLERLIAGKHCTVLSDEACA